MNNSHLWLDTAIKAAKAAGALVATMQKEPLDVISKGFRDVVTEADLAAQKLIKQIISEHHPEHGFVAEEDAAPTNAAETGFAADVPVWYIDPIDGTSNYSRLLPNFCVSLAVAVDGVMQAAVIYAPLHDELFTARKGAGAMLNGSPISVNEVSVLDETILAVDWSRDREERQAIMDMLQILAHEVRTVRSIGTAALAICWIACGRLEVYINFTLKAWDVAAAGLILEEAGGNMGGFAGNSFAITQPDSWQVSTNGHVHSTLLSTIPKSA